MSTEGTNKGNFFEFIPPPVECPECKHPRRIFGNNAICMFCKKDQAGEYWVLGKKLDPLDYHDFMEAGEAILGHIQHHTDPKKIIIILSEGLYIWSYAFNIIAAKAAAAQNLTVEFATRMNCLQALCGIKDSDIDEAMEKAAAAKKAAERK